MAKWYLQTHRMDGAWYCGNCANRVDFEDESKRDWIMRGVSHPTAPISKFVQVVCPRCFADALDVPNEGVSICTDDEYDEDPFSAIWYLEYEPIARKAAS